MRRWWIEEPKLLGSSNPTDLELEDLYQEGFRTIISLLDENEQAPYYEIVEIEARGFKRYSIPLQDFTAPGLAEFQKFMDIVINSLKKGKVLVHCQGGIGRTGTMGAAYWIKKGLSTNEAIKKIRKSMPGAIEMPEQEESLFELEAFIAEEVLQFVKKV
jgi:atypical dual specificity phosphatase